MIMGGLLFCPSCPARAQLAIDAVAAAVQHHPMASIAQNPDIRFLGRILGDVIRTLGGDALYRRTEYIRSTSVDRHRGVAGADTVDRGLDALTLDETLDFVRGFMLFSMLANLAEDRPWCMQLTSRWFRR